MITESQEDGDQLVIPAAQVRSPGGQKSPEESMKLIQKQLVLLLHAHACQKKDIGCQDENRFKCPVPNCKMMKDVWLHIKECKIGPDCSHLHCSSSLKILTHWKHCKGWECPVCHLVRLKTIQSTNRVALLGISGGPATNEVSGQSTKPEPQGQSQCQGQPEQPSEQMKPGSGLNGSRCYCHDCSMRGNTCQMESTQSLHHHPHQFHQQNQSFPPNPYSQQFQSPHQNPVMNQYVNGSGGVLHNGILPPSNYHPVGSGVKGDYRSISDNGKHCQCMGCTGHESTSEHRLFQMTYPPNSRHIPNSNQSKNSRKRSADPIPIDFNMTSRHKPNEGPVPSADDVRRAYEQLGIPCPGDALKRLMATLPGGSSDENPGQEVEFPDHQKQSQPSSDDDDGINVEEYTGQDDASSSSWCLSLVQRLVSNGHQITAGSS